jgi:hypothetical protein
MESGMPRGDYFRALKSLFGRTPVATMDDLRHRLGVASRTTVLSVLGRAGYLSSYTHAGKYYTLRHIPRFDAHGLWVHGGARFSKHGTLRNTVVVLVTESAAGHTHQELAAILGVRVHDTLRSLAEAGKIGRVHVGVTFVYVAADSTTASLQLSRREAMGAVVVPPTAERARVETPPPLDLARVIEVLVAVIHNPKHDAQQIAAHLLARGIEISQAQVEQVFATYEIRKKKTKSRSRRSRS